MKEIDFDDDIEILDPKNDDQNDKLKEYAKIYWSQRQRKGVTLYASEKLMRERNYFASMMVNVGDADAMISRNHRIGISNIYHHRCKIISFSH